MASHIFGKRKKLACRLRHAHCELGEEPHAISMELKGRNYYFWIWVVRVAHLGGDGE
jgi:hypothetical protein